MIRSIRHFLSNLARSRAGTTTTFHPTEKCAECGTPLMSVAKTGSETWRCPNLDCPAQIRARIEHWCSPAAMDIAGGDATLVAKLVSRGLIRDVAELYRLKVGEIAALEGMNQDSAKKFFNSITTSQKR